MASRERNELRFPQWDNLPNGGRRYYRIIPGKIRGHARYMKEVDANETTVRIVQEICNENGKITSIHQKYPEDTGHINIVESEE